MAYLLFAYRLLATLLTPVVGVLLVARLLMGKEDLSRLGERLGFSSLPRPSGALVWIHAASVGELISLLPLMQALNHVGGLQLLVTTVTRTSARLASECLPTGVIHQYVPLDHWFAFALFRRRWRPDLGVLAEAELWPEIIHAMPRLHLINARMTERSFRRHQRLFWYAAWLLGRCQVCLAQSPQDAARFRQLGAGKVEAVGSTKYDAGPLRVDPGIVARLEAVFAGRSVLLLASSHPGEEAQLLEALPRLRRQLPCLALLLVPRHPVRASEVERLAARQGLAVQRWSAVAEARSTPSLEVVVVDLIGQMGAWIASSSLVVMGGSLAVAGRCIGGHNPLEPVRLGRQVLCGPDMANFAQLSAQLAATGWLQSAQSLDQLWSDLVAHPAWRGLPPPPPLALQGPTGRIAEEVMKELGLVRDPVLQLPR